MKTYDKFKSHAYYMKHQKKISKYYHDRYPLIREHQLEIQNIYNQTPDGKRVCQKARQKFRQTQDRSGEMKLHGHTSYLKYHYSLILENCAICDTSKDIQMHHPNPDLPLHVYFLCRKHHFEQHRKRG